MGISPDPPLHQKSHSKEKETRKTSRSFESIEAFLLKRVSLAAGSKRVVVAPSEGLKGLTQGHVNPTEPFEMGVGP